VFEDDVEQEKARAEANMKALKSGKEGEEIEVRGLEAGDNGDSSDDGEQDPEFKIKVIDYSKAMPDKAHSHKPNGSVHNVGLKINLPDDSREDGTTYRQPPMEAYPVLNFQHKERSTLDIGSNESWLTPSSNQAKAYKENIENLYSGKQLEGFANQLRRLIQIRSKGRYEYGVSRGKLQRSAVHRVTTPDSPLSQKIFKRHIKSMVNDCAITILVDASGSMAGKKYLHATCAMMILSETIANVLRIPLEVLAFSDGIGFKHNREYKEAAEDMYLIRQFGEQQVGNDELIARMATVSQFFGANADGEAIVFALDRLLKQKQKRKLLIVLSDGQPVTSSTGSAIRPYTRLVNERIAATPNIDVVGIGIMSSEVKKYYKHHRVIKNASEIETVLLDVLREAVLEQKIS
jgi:cobalamin biosynthesis protein CobT